MMSFFSLYYVEHIMLIPIYSGNFTFNFFLNINIMYVSNNIILEKSLLPKDAFAFIKEFSSMYLHTV